MITTLPAIDSSGLDGSTEGYTSRETRFVNCMLVTKKSAGSESILTRKMEMNDCEEKGWL